jgi:putative membrane protein
MIKILADWILNALALFLVSKIIPGILLQDFWSALIAVIVIGLVNALIKPILLLLTLPINILTLGLFTFVVNALMLLLASQFTPGFKVDGFTAALLGSIVLSLISMVLQSLVRS